MADPIYFPNRSLKDQLADVGKSKKTIVDNNKSYFVRIAKLNKAIQKLEDKLCDIEESLSFCKPNNFRKRSKLYEMKEITKAQLTTNKNDKEDQIRSYNFHKD